MGGKIHRVRWKTGKMKQIKVEAMRKKGIKEEVKQGVAETNG